MITDDVDTILPCHARTDTKAQSNADGLSCGKVPKVFDPT